MSRFISPKVNEVHVDYIGKYTNNPVNIELCTSVIKKDKNSGYGKIYPVIIFKGCDVEWNYGENGTKIRDKQYDDIVNNR